MKKIIFSLAVLFTGIANGQELNYSPAPRISPSHEWLANFVKNKVDSLQVIADKAPKSDYDDYFSFLVFTKNGKAIVLFNKYDSSFIISVHSLPKLGPNDNYEDFYTSLIYSSSFDDIRAHLAASRIVLLTPINFYHERRKL